MATVTVVTIFVMYRLFSGIICQEQEILEKNREKCLRIARDPYFDMDIVVGEPWRIYYTWNMKLDTSCLDITFRNATRSIIKRIWSDMSEYLEQQPYWEAATLHMTLNTTRHEVLLFADQGAAGSFLAVPNVMRDSNLAPMRKTVPLLKFQMKLIFNTKYLLVMDCHVGGASLAARSKNPPFRAEIASAAATLGLGDGNPACTREKVKGEQFFV